MKDDALTNLPTAIIVRADQNGPYIPPDKYTPPLSIDAEAPENQANAEAVDPAADQATLLVSKLTKRDAISSLLYQRADRLTLEFGYATNPLQITFLDPNDAKAKTHSFQSQPASVPIVVVSHDHSQWLKKLFDNANYSNNFTGSVFAQGPTPWYAPSRTGGKLIYIVVHAEELAFYNAQLADIENVIVAGYRFPSNFSNDQIGLGVLGAGAIRYAAIELMMELGYQYAWLSDDNVIYLDFLPTTVQDSPSALTSIEAHVANDKTIVGIGFKPAESPTDNINALAIKHRTPPENLPLPTNQPLRQVVLWNINALKGEAKSTEALLTCETQNNIVPAEKINYSPLFYVAYEDSSLTRYLLQKNKNLRYIESQVYTFQPAQDFFAIDSKEIKISTLLGRQETKILENLLDIQDGMLFLTKTALTKPKKLAGKISVIFKNLNKNAVYDFLRLKVKPSPDQTQQAACQAAEQIFDFYIQDIENADTLRFLFNPYFGKERSAILFDKQQRLEPDPAAQVETFNLTMHRKEDASADPYKSRPSYNKALEKYQYNLSSNYRVTLSLHHIIPAAKLIELFNKILKKSGHFLFFKGMFENIKNNLQNYVNDNPPLPLAESGDMYPETEKPQFFEQGTKNAEKFIEKKILHSDAETRKPEYWEDFVQFYIWMPGNLFAGPINTLRVDDPGEGFEQYSSEAITSTKFTAMSALNLSIDNYLQDKLKIGLDLQKLGDMLANLASETSYTALNPKAWCPSETNGETKYYLALAHASLSLPDCQNAGRSARSLPSAQFAASVAQTPTQATTDSILDFFTRLPTIIGPE